MSNKLLEVEIDRMMVRHEWNNSSLTLTTS